MKKVILFWLLNIFFISCNSQKGVHCAYDLKLYIKSNSGSNIEVTPYILYGNTLFEFVTKVNYWSSKSIKNGTVKDSVWYDTTGFRLIFPKDKLFFETDAFSMNCKVTGYGRTDTLRGGTIVYTSSMSKTQAVLTTPLRDTLIGPTAYKYLDSTYYTENGLGMKFNSKFFFSTTPEFITIFALAGIKHTDWPYTLAGVYTKVLEPDDGSSVLIIPENIRRLTPEQEKICRHILFSVNKFKNQKLH